MKKVKQWMKVHKKEIIIGVAAIGGTALYFLRKEIKNKGVEAVSDLRVSFGFLNEEKDGDYYGLRSKSCLYTNLDLNKPGYTVGDLGKIGAELMKNIPSLTKDVPIDHLNANLSVIKK